MAIVRSAADVQARTEEIRQLLDRQRVLTTLATRQATSKRDLLEQMQRRENLAALQKHVRGVHPADLAAILESLPPDDRLVVWRQLPRREAGLTLVELSTDLRTWIVDALERSELVEALAELDGDDLGYLAESLPDDVLAEMAARLQTRDQSWMADTRGFPEDSVGRLMSPDAIAIREDQRVGDAIETLRARPDLPDQTDRLFVVDVRNVLRGSVPFHVLLRSEPDTRLGEVMLVDIAAFTPDEPAGHAAKAFERYDLVSAPVVDGLGKLVGRVTIDAVLDYVRVSSDQDALARAGLRGAEDLFATVAQSFRNRWPWLCLNLITAFAASRVIGLFEGTISRVLALAALMPIVASLGGNTGNQTVALVTRALALDQLHGSRLRLARKEVTVGVVNGAVWGGVLGLLAIAIYHNVALGAVMMAAVILNLLVAALAGVAVPLVLHHVGRDPAYGSSVMLTFITDGMGFLLFLGLARLVL
ncbi:MAG TPA: magnesium transporter [Vicinamibacterales bacterium]|nr:magnesium transporter [Vicinamibacterales bacterium]